MAQSCICDLLSENPTCLILQLLCCLERINNGVLKLQSFLVSTMYFWSYSTRKQYLQHCRELRYSSRYDKLTFYNITRVFFVVQKRSKDILHEKANLVMYYAFKFMTFFTDL